MNITWIGPISPSDVTTLQRLAGCTIRAVENPAEALDHIRGSSTGVIVVWAPMLRAACVDLIDGVQRIDDSVAVLVRVPGLPAAEAAGIKSAGAFQLIHGEPCLEDLAVSLCLAYEYREQRLARRTPAGAEPWRKLLIGDCPAMQRVCETIRLVAARKCTVLITGETGTGKEIVAQAIHAASPRAHVPIQAVNCSAIPETLVEAELFGHAKGAYTGATQQRIGRFEQANGGTVFLDEIGELPVDVQVKLLRVLQEREIQRLGSSDTIRLNVRVIAATNSDLREAVRTRRFREDLFYRLNVVPLELPPLRERTGDIPLLAEHFVRKICMLEGLAPKRLRPEALTRLSDYDWPGNVRQLEHAVETAVVLSGDRGALDSSDFPLHQSRHQAAASSGHFIHLPDDGFNFDETIARIERIILEQALARSSGNKARAADLLRMKRTTLLAKLKTHSFASAGQVA